MRIICVIASMDPGGAERVMSRLVTHLASRHDVLLITWNAPSIAPFYDLPQSVRLVQVDLVGHTSVDRAAQAIRRIAALRRHIAEFKPEVVLSFMDTTNLTTVLAGLGSRTPVVISERIDPTHYDIGRPAAFARRLLYPLADRLVVQTSRVASFFPRRLRSRMAVIANPIEEAELTARPGPPGPDGRFRIIGLGRLEHQKGFDLLIDAFARLAGRFPKWDVSIFGEGVDREALQSRARKHGVGDRVGLPGITRQPAGELAKSHIFAFPSRFEGFPNALGEAMVVGLPAVGYAEVSGVEDMIDDGTTGYLVHPRADIAALALALERLMGDARLRETMGVAASHRALRWRASTILEEWEGLLLSAARGISTARAS